MISCILKINARQIFITMSGMTCIGPINISLRNQGHQGPKISLQKLLSFIYPLPKRTTTKFRMYGRGGIKIFLTSKS